MSVVLLLLIVVSALLSIAAGLWVAVALVRAVWRRPDLNSAEPDNDRPSQ